MTIREMIRLLCTHRARERAEAATAEARFLAGQERRWLQLRRPAPETCPSYFRAPRKES